MGYKCDQCFMWLKLAFHIHIIFNAHNSQKRKNSHKTTKTLKIYITHAVELDYKWIYKVYDCNSNSLKYSL